MAFAFTPPTIKVYSDDLLFGRYGFTTGVSVVKVNGTFTELMSPWLGEIADLTEGRDWFQGGRTYLISESVKTELEDAGFITVEVDDPDPDDPTIPPDIVTDSPLYGVGLYGVGIYGS